MKRLFLLIYTGLLLLVPSFAQTPVENRLDELLQDQSLSASQVGLAIYDLTAQRPVFNYQEKKLFRPASVEKLITAITGLSRLGAGHRFETSLYYTGSIRRNTLNGDLYVVGGFDPAFSDEGMNQLVQWIDSIGIRKINGRIYGDVSLTDSLYWGPGWSWDDNPYDFQPYLSPLIYDRGCVKVTALPGEKGIPARISVSPVSDFYSVENKTRSDSPAAGKFTVTRNWLENGNHITVSGNVDYPRKEGVNLYTGKDFFMHEFVNRLRAGGMKAGEYTWQELPAGEEAICIGRYTHNLTEILVPAMKESDNLFAEAIFYQLAACDSGQKKVSSEEGTRAISTLIGQLGFNPKEYRIVDGSGVSLYNYVTPELLLAFLKYAYSDPAVYFPLYAALPVAGVDGTLSRRMKQGNTYANVRAKTGSVTGVSSLAGYVETLNGHLLAFVIINQNILEQGKARAFQDRVCEILSDMN